MGKSSPTKEERAAQSQRNAAVLVAASQRRYEAGERAALLEAINWCALGGIPLPSWAATAFVAGYNRVIFEYGTNTWDTIFGKPNKGRKLSQVGFHKKIESDLWLMVVQLRAKSPKPKDIFGTVGEHFKIGADLCEKIFKDYSRRRPDLKSFELQMRRSGKNKGK